LIDYYKDYEQQKTAGNEDSSETMPELYGWWRFNGAVRQHIPDLSNKVL